MAQCNAKSKRSGERCKNFCSTGRTTCRFHGGRTPRGFDLPQTRHGRYSNLLPPRLLTSYQKSLADPKNVGLRESIAVVDARLAEILKEVNLVDEEDRMDKARIQYRRIQKAYNKGDRADLHSAMIELDRLIRFGVREYQLWKEFFLTLERRQKLSMSQLKWEIVSGQMIPKEQAVALFKAAGEIIKEKITDPKVLEEICKDLDGLRDQAAEKEWAEYNIINIEEILKKSIRKPRQSRRQPNP